MSTIQNGLIGFFDILGYQAFLENNPPETAADTVLAVLGKLTGLKDEMLLHMMKDLDVLQDRIEVEPQWLVFSDTVLLYLDLNKVTEPLGHEPESRGQKIELHFYVFLLECIALWNAMFAAGLPLRGAITQGNYLVKGPCFAGIPIVQAHQLGNDLNCAGVAIDQSVEQWRNTNLPGAVGPGSLYYDYLFPSKSKGSMQGAALNLAYSLQKGEAVWGEDVRHDIEVSFSKHNKHIAQGVSAKVENTEKLLRVLKSKWPSAR
jgi:hypothetical protein